MAAIQDLRGSLEPKLYAVTADVTLLSGDLKKVGEKVTTAETDIARLQSNSKRFENQVHFLTTEHKRILARMEHQERRSRGNNIRVVGVPGHTQDLIEDKKMECRLQCEALECNNADLEAQYQHEKGEGSGLHHHLKRQELQELVEQQARAYALASQLQLNDVSDKANKLLVWLDKQDREQSQDREIMNT
ncbi:hypothetical protein NDU88_005390 [Pleurodeles waltl]|uniref:Uncharacterized protein n=1 Tax=Pleurodeles waltl TaxID=8319 RepID=A0AAV7MWA0_PLEWA|nr:hypothetical protein NDU88_005390 [Pleurodeles waltl]